MRGGAPGALSYSVCGKECFVTVTHFHLDRLCRRIGAHTLDFNKALAQVRPSEGLEVEVDGAVAVWCDPKTYPAAGG